jgi:hypothetical protein
MTALPPDIAPDDEIQVTWERDDVSTKVTATLGEATITVESSHEAGPTVPWLVASLPNILEAAWAAIEADQEGS